MVGKPLHNGGFKWCVGTKCMKGAVVKLVQNRTIEKFPGNCAKSTFYVCLVCCGMFVVSHSQVFHLISGHCCCGDHNELLYHIRVEC